MTNPTRRTDWNLGVKIEGLGNAAAPHDDKRWRWSQMYQEVPTGGGDLYVPVMVDFPTSFAAEIDFRGARSSLGGFAFEVQAQGIGASGITAASRLYRSRYVPIGFVGVAMTAAVETITINDAGGSGITSLTVPLGIALERECLVLTAHNGSGVYACKRGEFGTIAVSHAIGAADDTAIFESEHWHIPADREVVLFRCQRNRDLTNEETIVRGVVRDVSAPTPDRIRIDCAGPLELLQLRQLCSRLWRGTTLNATAANVLNVQGKPETWQAPRYINPAARDDSTTTGSFRTLLMLDGRSAVVQVWTDVSRRLSAAMRVHLPTSRSAAESRPFAGVFPTAPDSAEPERHRHEARVRHSQRHGAVEQLVCAAAAVPADNARRVQRHDLRHRRRRQPVPLRQSRVRGEFDVGQHLGHRGSSDRTGGHRANATATPRSQRRWQGV